MKRRVEEKAGPRREAPPRPGHPVEDGAALLALARGFRPVRLDFGAGREAPAQPGDVSPENSKPPRRR